jgi:DHA2 family methylenomycin A resistance protein-like MFS transporter
VSGRRTSPGPLVALGAGYFMVIMDATIVNVSLPNLERGLHTGLAGLQWVVDGYTLVFASVLLSAGALGDRLGAKRVFLAGLGLFVVTSVACGLAWSVWALVAARLVQGLAAALVVPASLALIRAAHPDRAARARAIGAWGVSGGIAAASGPVLGGLLTGAFGWRAVFFVNAPVGVAAVVLTARAVPSPEGRPDRALDLAAQVAAIVGLAALAYGLIEAGQAGFSSARVIGPLSLFAAAALAFALLERAVADPMLPPSLARIPTFAFANGVGVLMNIGFYGLLFVTSLSFQEQRGYPAALAGLAILPLPGLAAIASYLGGRVTGRAGSRPPMALGMAIAAASSLALGVVADARTPYALLAPALAGVGFGTALAMPAAVAAVVESAPGDRSGLASGVLNASRQAGSVIGVALLGSLVADGTAFGGGVRASLVAAAVAFAGAGALALLAVDRAPTAPP